jgi:putative tryptophan/tyrosine transport system substrate-binding protein
MLLFARQVIAEAAAAKKLPTLYGYNEHVEAGGLISYGVTLDPLGLIARYSGCI